MTYLRQYLKKDHVIKIVFKFKNKGFKKETIIAIIQILLHLNIATLFGIS